MRKLIWLSCLLLSGCGFQLRSGDLLPAKLHHLTVDSKVDYSRAQRRLSAQLSAAGVTIDNHAPYHLVILRENLANSFSAVSVTQMTTNTLTYTISYQIVDQQHKTVFGPLQAQASQQMISNANQMLGSDTTSGVIKDELIRDTVNQIIDQLLGQKASKRFFNDHLAQSIHWHVLRCFL